MRNQIVTAVLVFVFAGVAHPQDQRFQSNAQTGQATAHAGSDLAANTLAEDNVKEGIHHNLDVFLDPINGSIRVSDRITFPDSYLAQPLTFSLNENLRITDSTEAYSSLRASSPAGVVNSNTSQMATVTNYSIRLNSNNRNELTLSYEGVINDFAEQNSAEYAQSFAETTGIISEQGIYLGGTSAWIPYFDEELIRFTLKTTFSERASTWSTLSQGELISLISSDIESDSSESYWQVTRPTEEVFLIAANFTVYSQQAGDVEVMAYLRTADPNIAAKYMDATDRYLQLYEPMLGDYPYSKFALVENFWETGYGMPSFTLLGEQVIRFPFILESSYPHEILHNWWGNGVYPDYDSGNWSEGLTAYLADHLFQEMEGLGHEYRKEMLARYKNYVADSSDFPLADFTSRNSAASQAVGYGKTLMLWHMLRVEVGDEVFLQGLRQFYRDFKFSRASFNDIASLFSELSGSDLSNFFNQWVNRTGAPELSVAVEEANGNMARIMFAQIHSGDPYALKVPVALFYEGEEEPQIFDIALAQKLDGVMAEDYERLQAVLVDPYFDVFRTLDREETPPTIGELFGAGQITFVLPSTDREYWAQMAESFGQGVNFTIVNGDEVGSIPEDQSVWILGKDNPLAATLAIAAENYGVEFNDSNVTLAGGEVNYTNRSSVLIARHPSNPELAIGWIQVDDMVAMPGMIEKLPHYGKYSYLSFSGDEPTNDIKRVWSSSESPLRWIKPNLLSVVNFDALPPTEPIAVLPPKYLPEQLLRHSRKLTDSNMQGRGLGSLGLDLAALYVADQFRAAGLVALDGTYIQRWVQSIPGAGLTNMGNVIGMIPGSNRDLSSQPIIIGAHYDHLGVDPDTGLPFVGADDNASGISILIEVAAKLARSYSPQRPIIFVAFTAEESGLLGSEYFINNPPAGLAAEDMFAMINLDTVGRLEGRTLQIFSTESAYEWPFMAQGIGFTIGVNSTFPADTIASSDHVNFLNAGIPAIHLFAGLHSDYHQTSDTIEKLDAVGMSDISLWLEEATVYLADLADPLRVNLGGEYIAVSNVAAGERAASLGTVPDFAFSGEGIRITGVSPEGAGKKAGLIAGDILLTYNGEPMGDLQNYSNLLRASAPGDSIQIEVLRGEEIISVDAILQAR